jgi:Activator of Hsp90 ATPase homolog 1-like protein
MPASPPTGPGLPPGIPDGVRHRITFEPAGDGRTTMTVTEYGYTTDEARDTSRLGLEQTLDKLADLFG